jgi:hypothetical protein
LPAHRAVAALSKALIAFTSAAEETLNFYEVTSETQERIGDDMVGLVVDFLSIEANTMPFRSAISRESLEPTHLAPEPLQFAAAGSCDPDPDKPTSKRRRLKAKTTDTEGNYMGDNAEDTEDERTETKWISVAGGETEGYKGYTSCRKCPITGEWEYLVPVCTPPYTHEQTTTDTDYDKFECACMDGLDSDGSDDMYISSVRSARSLG